MENQPIILERNYNAPIIKVWQALTDINEMRKWYFDLAEFKAEVGFKFQFYGGKDPETQYLHRCEVTEAIFEKKLTYSWRYDGYPGNSFVTFELFNQDDKTTLRLTHRGLETLAAGSPDFARENFVEGWTHFVNIALKEYLES
ncbi:MAG: SRPBCC domain-containing protein [Bacteroidales bacterium]|jgi:uncharacterized protein YndB with AHSA1/START domain|nr:SRPBCC domain-containing protein [Bacteroidales bacterium]